MPSIGYGSNKKTRHLMPDGFKKFVIHNVKVSNDYSGAWFYMYFSECSGKFNSQTINVLNLQQRQQQQHLYSPSTHADKVQKKK